MVPGGLYIFQQSQVPFRGAFCLLAGCVGQVWCWDGSAGNGENNPEREERMQWQITSLCFHMKHHPPFLPPPPRVCVHEVCRKASKLLKYNQLTTFREVAASSLFHFMMSLWRRLVWELLSHTVMNWTFNFSCQLELGSDSHWKTAPDTLTPSACFLPFPMRNSSPGYMLILSPITTSPPTFTGSPQ